MNKILATIAGVALTVLPAAAFAASPATGSVNVSATVVAACSISTPNALAFGNYDPSAPAGPGNNATAGESIQCTATTLYTLSVPGTASLTGPGAALSVTSVAVSPSTQQTASGGSDPFSVSGTLAPGQYSAPGNYAGSILVSAAF